MPKIFLIKNRLHQQQLRLQESQSLLVNKDDQALCPGSPLDESEPLPLVAKRDKKDGELSSSRGMYVLFVV